MSVVAAIFRGSKNGADGQFQLQVARLADAQPQVVVRGFLKPAASTVTR